MHVLMLGANHQYATGFGASSVTVPAGADSAKFMGIYNTYIQNGYDADTAMSQATMDYNAFASYDAAASQKTSKGTTTGDALQSFAKENPTLVSNLSDLSKWAAFASALQGKGYTANDINNMGNLAKHPAFNLQAATPWLIIGGVALVAVLFMFGTRGRR